MRKIFVSGAYNGSNVIECLDNIKVGLRVCAYLLSKNYLPFCPWTDFLFHLVADVDWTPTLEQYRRYCLSLIKVSSLVFVISGLDTHEGVQQEVNFAHRHNIPVIVHNNTSRSVIEISKKVRFDPDDVLFFDLMNSMYGEHVLETKISS